MSDTKKPVKVEFAPGCFDNFEGTQEELDAFMQEIIEMFQDPEKIADSIREIDLDELDDETLEKIAYAIDPDLPSGKTLH